MLKYLFECEFQDGTIIEQTPADKSQLDPTKSEFYDVLHKDQTSPIIRFALHGDNKYLLVDLRDGHFELNGVAFLAHETLPQDNPLRRLIFYRTHQAQTNLTADGQLQDTQETITGYTLGWQTTIDGKNYKETITLI